MRSLVLTLNSNCSSEKQIQTEERSTVNSDKNKNKYKGNTKHEQWNKRKRIHTSRNFHFTLTVISRNPTFHQTFYSRLSLLEVLQVFIYISICCLSIATFRFRNCRSRTTNYVRHGSGNFREIALSPSCLSVRPCDGLFISIGFLFVVGWMSANVSRCFSVFLSFFSFFYRDVWIRFIGSSQCLVQQLGHTGMWRTNQLTNFMGRSPFWEDNRS